MSLSHSIRDSLRLLEGLESGTLNGADAYEIADKVDPFILSSIFQFLRQKYPASNSASAGVMARLVELSSTYPEIVAKVKNGEKDLLNEWFQETHTMSEFYPEPERFLEVLMEKVEG